MMEQVVAVGSTDLLRDCMAARAGVQGDYSRSAGKGQDCGLAAVSARSVLICNAHAAG